MTPIELLLAKLPDAKRASKGWSARCPAHEDRRASLSIAEGKDGRALVKCHAGCKVESICSAVGLRVADLMPKSIKCSMPAKLKGKPRIVAEYDYRDESGNVLFQVVRYDPKDFRQRRPDGKGGWTWGVKGVRVVPYRLPELLAEPTRPVVVVEGEKDCDNLAGIDVLATCNAGGAGKWTAEHSEFLRGRHVIIICDNDEAGRTHARLVAESVQGIAKSVRIVVLPGLPEKGDASNWIEAGGTKEELLRLVNATTVWTPAAAEETADSVPKPPEFVPFPTDLLPAPARTFVETAAEALGCDTAYVALPLLAALAASVGNVRRIQLKKSWCEPCVFWTVIIGESGTLKSPAIEVALEFLKRKQAAEHRKHQEEMRDHEQRMQRYDADLMEWKRKGRKANESAPQKSDPPIWRQRHAEDTTVEALAVLLEDQPRGLLVSRDELSGWLNSFDAYKSARGADVAHWLSMHRAGSMLVNRKSGRTFIHVPRSAVSICGGVQPHTLAAALAGRYSSDGDEQMEKPKAEHFANGLAARLLLAHPPRLPKYWTETDIDDAVSGAMQQRFDELFALEAPTDENGELVPVDLPLTADAKSRFVAFYNEHAKEQCKLGADLAAAWSKAEGYAARFALLCELVANPQSTAVGDGSMEAGIGLARWFVDEAVRIYAELGGNCADSEGRTKRELTRLEEWVRARGGCVTTREVQMGCRWLREPGTAETALEQLVSDGRGNWEATPAGRRGQPTRHFRLENSSTVNGNGILPGESRNTVDTDTVDTDQSEADGEWGEV